MWRQVSLLIHRQVRQSRSGGRSRAAMSEPGHERGSGLEERTRSRGGSEDPPLEAHWMMRRASGLVERGAGRGQAKRQVPLALRDAGPVPAVLLVQLAPHERQRVGHAPQVGGVHGVQPVDQRGSRQRGRGYRRDRVGSPDPPRLGALGDQQARRPQDGPQGAVLRARKARTARYCCKAACMVFEPGVLVTKKGMLSWVPRNPSQPGLPAICCE